MVAIVQGRHGCLQHTVILEAEGVDAPQVLCPGHLHLLGQQGLGLGGRVCVERLVGRAEVNDEVQAGLHGLSR